MPQTAAETAALRNWFEARGQSGYYANHGFHLDGRVTAGVALGQLLCCLFTSIDGDVSPEYRGL